MCWQISIRLPRHVYDTGAGSDERLRATSWAYVLGERRIAIRVLWLLYADAAILHKCLRFSKSHAESNFFF